MSRYSLIFVVLISTFLWSCKGSSTGPGNDGGTTPASVGDTIPRTGTVYNYEKGQLYTNDSVNIGTIVSFGINAQVNNTGISYQGKDNAYFIADEGDTVYCAYESNGDVSFYFLTPDYYQITDPQNPINEPLLDILNLAFHQWVTLPIASKKTGVNIFHKTGQNLSISQTPVPADIDVTVDYVGDSTITIGISPNTTQLAAKHCRITINATMKPGTNVTVPLSHIRNIWFVPRIGYIAQTRTRTDMQPYPIYLIPRDTTGRFKALLSYKLN